MVTRKFDEDPSKMKMLSSWHFLHYKSIGGKNQQSQISKGNSSIYPEFEPDWDFMPVQAIWNSHKDPIKTMMDGELVF